MGVGAFLRKQGRGCLHGSGPPSGQERRPGGNAAGRPPALSSARSHSGALGVGRAPEERRRDEPREARARGQAFGLQGGKEERGARGGPGEARTMLKMALGPGGSEGEGRAGGRHDSRFRRRGVPPRASVPAPTFSFPGRPDAKEEREPLFSFCLF